VIVPWGEAPGRNALAATRRQPHIGCSVMEAVTHTWDLSEALGRPLELDPELAGFALAHRVLPEGEREDDPELPFGSVVPTPEGADTYGQLAAYLGRLPLS